MQTDTSLDIEMVFVEGDTFFMGCTLEQKDDCFEREKPVHEVTLSNFYIIRFDDNAWSLLQLSGLPFSLRCRMKLRGHLLKFII
jgi:hypothetical protein